MSCRKANGKYTAYVYRWKVDGLVIPLNAEIFGVDVDLNNSTQVAVQLADGSTYGAACRWNALTGTLDPIGGTSTRVYGINDSGTVCGRTAYKAFWHPFRYTNSLKVLLDQHGSAVAINSNSDLFCWSTPPKGANPNKPHIYTEGSFYDVDSLIDPSDRDAALWSSKSSVTAVDMNDRIGATGFGQLVGTIGLADGSQWCYLLTPKP
ncbi:MAG: hypothetical protein ACYC3X_16640 [Pirellulaceae bacterium]